ncbi:MAG: hypothetical protein U9P82_08615 [Bacteroidota bacterium]|nr:hypothetical protein [Bacteroidota bacterium]
MNKLFSIIVAASVLLSVNACNQTNKKQNNKTENQEKTINYLSVDDVFAKGETLSGKTVHVEGIIEHVCKHTWKRFKIIGKSENQFIKIELGDKFPTIDASITGKKAKVTGKLIPVKMDAKMVKEWEEKIRENHKGEEDTEHFKEEIAFIQDIYQQITSGKIPHYTNYTIEAENYELE